MIASVLLSATLSALLYARPCEDSSSCGRFDSGEKFGGSDDLTQTPSDAAKMVRQACKNGDLAACYALARGYETGEAGRTAPRKALRLLHRTCKDGYGRACSYLGALQVDEGDYRRAAPLYRQGCEGDDPLGCTALGTLHMTGDGVEVDYGRAAELLRMACSAQEFLGCTNLGGLYAEGLGVTRDYARAAELYSQACDGEVFEACTELAGLYEAGNGVTLDLARAAELYRQACDGGVRRACEGAVRLK